MYGTALYGGGMPEGKYGSSGESQAGGGGGSGLGGWSGALQALLDKQMAENEKVGAENRANWGEALNYAKGQPQRFAADPLTQGARALSQRLLNDPEAINDRTQQFIINRASNLTNAAANAQRSRLRGDLGAAGMLGGSSEQAMLDRMERERMARLMGLTSDLEIQRANQRNRDIMAASGMGAQRAMEQAGQEQALYSEWMRNLPMYQPTDMSGYGALYAAQMGGGMGGGMGMGGGGGGGRRELSPGFGGGFGREQPERPGISGWGMKPSGITGWQNTLFGAGREALLNAGAARSYAPQSESDWQNTLFGGGGSNSLYGPQSQNPFGGTPFGEASPAENWY